ncbi:arsenical pump family protein [Spirochaetia bacterium]|nr:arsenical pump family protein [Spirochaetia bacterium]
MSNLAWVTLVLFLVAYIIIAREKINKTIVALIGAAVFILLKIISQNAAFAAIDWNVLFLLVSMMVIVGITKHTGLFQYLAIKTAKIGRGDPIKILIMLSCMTALLSAFLDNVTTIVLLCPVIMLIAIELGISPVPFIISAAIASNIGGTATLIGDPPNIMIGSKAGLNFMDFLVNLGPVIIVVLIIFSFIVILIFRKQLVVDDERKKRIMNFDEKKSLENKPLMIKCIFVLVLTIAGFLFHGKLEIEASTVALLTSSLMLLLSGKHEIDEFFKDVEWSTIFFFIGLFIMVQGLVDMGWVSKCAAFLINLTNGNMPLTSVLLIWVSGILSAIVDNIPYVATMIPMVQEISENMGVDAVRPLWWSLSLGACLGGNATLVGSSAGVISANISSKNGYPISFMDFTKYGALVTFISLSISTAYVLIVYY